MNLKSFKSPEAIYRAYPFFSLNDKLDKDELERQIDEFADKGYGGVFLHSRVGLVTGYLSSDWMKLMCASVREAKNTKTYAWLYDEDKWPSGFAGGEVPKLGKAYRNHALILLEDTKPDENDEVLSEFDQENHHYSICANV
ncbi:MAG: alpha-L-rhamnosidase, partial [Athalassotoga sp.]